MIHALRKIFTILWERITEETYLILRGEGKEGTFHLRFMEWEGWEGGMTSPGRGRKQYAHSSWSRRKCLSWFLTLIKLSISPPSAFLHILPSFPHTWLSRHFFWPFLDSQSKGLSFFEPKDSWKCLPAMSSLHQPVPMKSQVISSSRVFKKT